MGELSTALLYYKRKDIQEAIVSCAPDREFVGSYGGQGYAKRPDVLNFPSDVLELVKSRITSFHASEERWTNPLQLNPSLPKKEVDDLRLGWDLVLDIDCPVWELSKIITFLFVKSLRDNGIRSITVKFSGNKGFHIGVPFEAFPSVFQGTETRLLFPEAARKIANYLLHYIAENYVKVEKDKVSFLDFKYSFSQLEEMTGKTMEELTDKYTLKWGKHVKVTKDYEMPSSSQYGCQKCGAVKKVEGITDLVLCEKCNFPMERLEHSVKKEQEVFRKFNPLSIIEVDTILISTRHLFRAPYSLHEKSGLVSLPITESEILSFDKSRAKPELIKFERTFLERENVEKDQASQLMDAAYKFSAEQEAKKVSLEEGRERYYSKDVDYEDIKEAIPQDFFPPCILKMLSGMEDGKKRALFIMTNFLSSAGWNHEQIEEFLDKWNENNPEPLREVYLKGHLRHHKMTNKKVLPPNCDNKMYYVDLGCCMPDGLCSKIRNPVTYAIRKAKFGKKKEAKTDSSNNK